MLAYWNNSLWIDMLPHSDTLSWFHDEQSLPYLLDTACLAEMQQISILLSGFTQQGLEPTIYCTRGKYANLYTTDVV